MTAPNNRYTENLGCYSPKDDKFRLKESLKGADDNMINNFSTRNSINISKPDKFNMKLESINKTDSKDSVKLMNKLAVLRQNLFSNTNKKKGEELIKTREPVKSPKEFACCAIYNEISIQDKLYRYSSSIKMEIKQVKIFKERFQIKISNVKKKVML